MSAANDMSSEARKIRDQATVSGERMGDEARKVKDQVVSSGERLAEDAGEELARLRAQVERLMEEKVTPALAGAADQVQDYANRARDSIEHQADALSGTVRDRPLLAIGVAAAAGWLLGRLMAGNTYVYPASRH